MNLQTSNDSSTLTYGGISYIEAVPNIGYPVCPFRKHKIDRNTTAEKDHFFNRIDFHDDFQNFSTSLASSELIKLAFAVFNFSTVLFIPKLGVLLDNQSVLIYM